MLNLSHNYSEKDHRYYPMCEQSVQIQEYRHIRGCYEFHTISTNISKKLATQGESMEFYILTNHLKRQC